MTKKVFFFTKSHWCTLVLARQKKGLFVATKKIQYEDILAYNETTNFITIDLTFNVFSLLLTLLLSNSLALAFSTSHFAGTGNMCFPHQS